MNPIGFVAALAAFLSVWFGHVAVRKVEFNSPRLWIPTTIFTILGLTVEFLSLSVPSHPLSIALGILGITLLFDAFELFRQQKRVVKGHAPANPNNPRHAAILDQYKTATTQNPLTREPLGRTASAQEANHPITNY